MKETRVQTRREFCIHACRTASLVALGGALGSILESCNKSDNPVSANLQDLPTIQGTVINGTITINIDPGSALSAVGSAALVQYANGALLIAQTAQNSFTALTAICTHEGCTIAGYSNQTYTCPCHGSQFNTDGQVVRGPASLALRKYQTQFANNKLTITLA